MVRKPVPHCAGDAAQRVCRSRGRGCPERRRRASWMRSWRSMCVELGNSMKKNCCTTVHLSHGPTVPRKLH
ncbi:hypothetical protein J4Q44_G00004390 [Coregonus suidteri]|uniref:Uncharacterized protein n=1 Tax=Coregonus suidteri TaxID=861788 RepID=A0AAN8R7S9_9TELE